MKAYFELKNILQSMDGKDDTSYQSIQGEYLFKDYTLFIDNVQADSSKCLSKVRVRMTQSVALFPADTYSSRSREIAIRDYITRTFHYSIENSQVSSLISVDSPGQEILERTSAFINKSFVEIRFNIYLPATDNLVDANLVEEIIFNKLPPIINNSIIFENLDRQSLYNHIETSEDADFLRNELENLRLIAFVAEDSILPRQLDKSSLPLDCKAVPFKSPDTLKMDVELPNKGQITGMGLLRGITLITGDKNNGKSTLLKAIEQGIYNHIPGDGREYVVSNPNSVRVRTEDGRSIKNVDLSPFIKTGQNIDSFSTGNAESYISQVANLIESVEVGADVLLIDEDTSANNFLYKDINTQEHNLQKDNFKTPFINKAKSLYNEYMVSSILAIEHPEDYFAIANYVIQMSNFKALDITEEAKEVAQKDDGSDSNFGIIKDRIPLSEGLDMTIVNNDIKIANNNINSIQFGSEVIDISSIEQLVTVSQINAIRDAIKYAQRYMDGKKSFRQLTSLVMLDIGRSGLDILTPQLSGDYAEFRKIEFAALINRLSTLKVKQNN